MRKPLIGLTVFAEHPAEKQAAEILCAEIETRTGERPAVKKRPDPVSIGFRQDASIGNKDAYRIETEGSVITVFADGIRGFLYGIGLFLRKTVYHNGIELVQPIDGSYTPHHRIRGHQLGYRPCSNTYDAWDLEQYRRYYLDMMYFGANTVEHIPAGARKDRNEIMQFDADELCFRASEIADEYDLDVSLWFPNDDLPLDESVALRKMFFEKCPRINALFIPGGDPGDLPADRFMERVKAIAHALKEVKPDAQVWPSAQAPHSIPEWGDGFLAQMWHHPDEVDGVITGPNRAFPLDVLRDKLPKQYDIRFYPDITHNVRCEHPVHFLQDDWHYALAAALSRESINPRPEEYALLHRMTNAYVVGSVSYSEGVNDDVNKMVWADLDFDPNRDVNNILLDYARLFFWQAPAENIAEGILALEKNWNGDPAENPHIERTLCLFSDLSAEYPLLLKNWRFLQLLFRAECDALVRRRRLFEQDLVHKAVLFLEDNLPDKAADALQTPLPENNTALRATIERHADDLYTQIGIQLSTERHHASAWERGATLDTIDLPVTDRAFYLNRIRFAQTLPPESRERFFRGLLQRNTVLPDEMYFSFAEHGLTALGMRQTPDFYMDFKGDDRSVNNGSIPMSQLKLFDHFSCRFRFDGCTPHQTYLLRVAYSSKMHDFVTSHTVKVNGRVLYCGKQYGGESDETFDRWYLSPCTRSATYAIPAEWIDDRRIEVLIEEPTVGVKLCEFWLLRADRAHILASKP